MADLFSERSKMRNVADSTALWGASSIALTGEEQAPRSAPRPSPQASSPTHRSG